MYMYARQVSTVTEKMLAAMLSLSLLSILVPKVRSQVFPRVSFMGQTLANHSYADLSLVGSTSDSVQCHTDLSTCCSGPQGIHRGDWLFPNGTRLPFSGDNYEDCGAQSVGLHLNNATSTSGLYWCDIATIAVHDDGYSSMGEKVYVGLYISGGMPLK